MNKNILVVVNSLLLGGGTERIAAQIGSHLNKRGNNVTFLARYDAPQKYDFQGEYIYRYDNHEDNILKKIIRESKGPKKIAEICKEKNINTVLSFSYSPNYCAILSKILFGNEAKIVISVRNNPLRLLTKKHQLLNRMLYPKADIVIAQTNKIKNILKKNFSVTNCIVIPNMVDLSKFEKLSKEPIPKRHKNIFNKNDFIFISVGSLIEQKAHCHLIRCFKKLSQTNEDIKLIVLGNGPLKNNLIEMTKKMAIENKVLFLGKVENVLQYLRHSDCFVLTSLYEGFPNVLLEALSQRLTVISTDCISGPREILCPKLAFNEEIDYPYYGKYGILTKNFKLKTIYKTLEECPLSEEEKMFSETMIKVASDIKLRGRYSNGLQRTKDFETKKIIRRWQDLR